MFRKFAFTVLVVALFMGFGNNHAFASDMKKVEKQKAFTSWLTAVDKRVKAGTAKATWPKGVVLGGVYASKTQKTIIVAVPDSSGVKTGKLVDWRNPDVTLEVWAPDAAVLGKLTNKGAGFKLYVAKNLDPSKRTGHFTFKWDASKWSCMLSLCDNHASVPHGNTSASIIADGTTVSTVVCAGFGFQNITKSEGMTLVWSKTS